RSPRGPDANVVVRVRGHERPVVGGVEHGAARPPWRRAHRQLRSQAQPHRPVEGAGSTASRSPPAPSGHTGAPGGGRAGDAAADAADQARRRGGHRGSQSLHTGTTGRSDGGRLTTLRGPFDGSVAASCRSLTAAATAEGPAVGGGGKVSV